MFHVSSEPLTPPPLMTLHSGKCTWDFEKLRALRSLYIMFWGMEKFWDFVLEGFSFCFYACKKYVRNMWKIWRYVKKYVGNMKKYPLLYGLWNLQKFQDVPFYIGLGTWKSSASSWALGHRKIPSSPPLCSLWDLGKFRSLLLLQIQRVGDSRGAKCHCSKLSPLCRLWDL